jgi:hypothetical protein
MLRSAFHTRQMEPGTWRRKCLNTYSHYSFKYLHAACGEQGSSVSIVSGYGLDDRPIEVRSPAEAKGFFL